VALTHGYTCWLSDSSVALHPRPVQIDTNGDGVLEWEEFSSFIVEMGMCVPKLAPCCRACGRACRVSRPLSSCTCHHRRSSSASDGESSITYQECRTLLEKTMYSNLTQRLRYFPAMDQFCRVEEGSDVVKFYSASGRSSSHGPSLSAAASSKGCGQLLRTVHVPSGANSVTCSVKAVEHIPSMGQLAVTASNGRVLFFDDGMCGVGSIMDSALDAEVDTDTGPR
jgi:hypothetical protein